MSWTLQRHVNVASTAETSVQVRSFDSLKQRLKMQISTTDILISAPIKRQHWKSSEGRLVICTFPEDDCRSLICEQLETRRSLVIHEILYFMIIRKQISHYARILASDQFGCASGSDEGATKSSVQPWQYCNTMWGIVMIMNLFPCYDRQNIGKAFQNYRYFRSFSTVYQCSCVIPLAVKGPHSCGGTAQLFLTSVLII